MEDLPRYTDLEVNTQLTEKNFVKTDYIFYLRRTERQLDHAIDPAFENLKAILIF